MTPPTTATPYPSNIVVPATTGTISKVTVTLNGIAHTYPDDMDMLLVAPDLTRKMVIWSDACGGAAISNLTITLDDAAAAALPDSFPCVAGTYRPAAWLPAQDAFPAPAPAGPYAVPEPGGPATLAIFNGASATGTWSLYIVDDASGDTGSIQGGWSLNFSGTTGVRISSFVARPATSGVVLTWRTGSEVNVAGFNVYRRSAATSTRVNARMIKAKAAGTTRGADYPLLDPTARRGVSYTYRLETVTQNGLRSSRVFATVIW